MGDKPVSSKIMKKTNNTNNTNQEKVRVLPKQQQNNTNNIVHSSGGVYGTLVLEPLGYGRYLYNYGGKKGTAIASHIKESDQYVLSIETEQFILEGKPTLKPLPYWLPSEESIKKYLCGEWIVKDQKTLFNDIVKAFELLYDTKHIYHLIAAVGVFESWILHTLQAVFFIGFRAQFNAAKTVFLEGLALLCRHGFLTGNINAAGVARNTERYSLSIFIDEIDSRKERGDLEEIFRTGYRRGNPYARQNEKNFNELELFNTFGFKGYSLHSQTEDALRSRSITIPLNVSTDTTLPVLNLYKRQLLKSLYENLFFWYLENASSFVVRVACVAPISCFLVRAEMKEARESLFKELTKDFSKVEVDALQGFFGRSEELMYIALSVCKILGVNLVDELVEVFNEKKGTEVGYLNHYQMSILRELLVEIYNGITGTTVEVDAAALGFILEIRQISEGEIKNCKFVNKMHVYEIFRKRLYDKGVRPVSLNTFSEFLLELGFNENLNIKRERFGSNKNDVRWALIFDRTAKRYLGIEEGKVQPNSEQIKLGSMVNKVGGEEGIKKN
jgi:hypothetical protein